MKKISATFALLLASSVLLHAASAKVQTLSGHLVDVSCTRENQQKPRADFPQKHSRKCLQMDPCEQSGYGLLTRDNKFYRFDAAGNAQAKKAIAASTKERDITATVTGTVSGDSIAVSSVQLH